MLTTNETRPMSRGMDDGYDVTTVSELQRPLDRVRWPAVVAGLFGTLSLLAVLTVLGLAIGFSSVDYDSDANNFGIGAGVWGGVATVLAFALGGYIAAGTAAARGTCNALVQGATVWMVTVGLLVYLVAGGVGAMFNTATRAVTATAQGVAANPTVTNPDSTNAAARPGDQATDATRAAESVQQALTNTANSVTRDDVVRTADTSATGAWGTFLALMVGLGAALGGSYIGRREKHVDVVTTR
jgi:hypothetical protein